MSRSIIKRIAAGISDIQLALSQEGPPLARILDRDYMASWHMFHEFEPSSVKTLIDIGAHDGLYAYNAARYFALDQVILVEPLPEKAEKLCGLKLPGMRVIPAAVSDYCGKISFAIVATTQASSIKKINSQIGALYGLDMSESGSIDVPVTTLDQIFLDENLSSIDLVKIDVQGAERELLAGAANCLSKIRLVQIEMLFADHYADSAKFCQLHQTLSAAGFKLLRLIDFVHSSDGALLQCDAVYRNEKFE